MLKLKLQLVKRTRGF